MNHTPHQTLDCRGLTCPMPALKTQKALKGMRSGQVLEVLGTDPDTKEDMPTLAQKSGHHYLGNQEDDGFTRFYFRVK